MTVIIKYYPFQLLCLNQEIRMQFHHNSCRVKYLSQMEMQRLTIDSLLAFDLFITLKAELGSIFAMYYRSILNLSMRQRQSIFSANNWECVTQ